MKHAFLSKVKIVLSWKNISQNIEFCQGLSGCVSTTVVCQPACVFTYLVI